MILASLITFGVFLAVMGFRDMNEKRLPTKLTVSSLSDYMNSNHHWHDAGHFLAQFFLVSMIGAAITDPFKPVAIFSTLLVTYLLEFVLQRSSGQSHKDRIKEFDVQFDIATHVLGGLAALFLLI